MLEAINFWIEHTWEGDFVHVTIVHVWVKSENIREFINTTKINHQFSIQESGNLRFDVLQSPEDPQKFILYEAYIDKDAAAAHKATQHYLTWRETVADWMAQPREGINYCGLYPEAD